MRRSCLAALGAARSEAFLIIKSREPRNGVFTQDVAVDGECGLRGVGRELQRRADDVLRLGLVEVGRGRRGRLVDDVACLDLRHASCRERGRIERYLCR
jgi:hypothetical protein